MKKKGILTAALALVLIASPFGGMNVSAEEDGEVSAQAESRAAASAMEVLRLGTLNDVRFSEDLMRCCFSFPTVEYGRYMAHIRVYRDGELFKEYDTRNDDSSPWNIYLNQGENDGSYRSVELPFYQDLEESGSYYFEVRMEKTRSGSLSVSETATSATVQYTRPEQALGTTIGYWDAEKEGIFHFTSVEGAAGYEYRLYKEYNGEWYPCILRTTSAGTYTNIGHQYAFSDITSGSAGDAGGEDRTIDFTPHIFGNAYVAPEGRYRVTIRALSGNPTEIANGVEGTMSDILQTGEGEADQADEDTDTDTASVLETRIETAQSGDVIHLQNVTTLSSSEVRQLLDNGLTLEMEYTYEGVDYKVRIPAGASMDDSIPWYGPLYLAQHYGVSSLGRPSAAGGPSYTVQQGDTLGKIARANNMSLTELAAKNPQIKNIDIIIPGQAIQLK